MQNGTPILEPMTFNQLITHFGTQQKTATALGLVQSSVAEWKRFGIPYGRQCQVQIFTNGKLKAERH